MKPYRTFFLKLIVFIVCFILIDFLGGFCLERIQQTMQNKHPGHIKYKTTYMIDRCYEDIIIVGSSTASHHYNSEKIEEGTGLTTYNCAMDGHFFIYQNALIHMMLKRHQPKVLIWEIGEHFLSTPNNLEYQTMNDLYPYYADMDIKELIDKKDRFQKYRMTSRLFRYNSTLFQAAYLLLKPREFNKGFVPLEASDVKSTTMVTEIDSINNKPDIEKEKLFVETVKLLKEKNVFLVITSSPRNYHASTLNTTDYTRLLSLIEEYHIPYINSYGLFTGDSTLFRDADHLNENGANKYMDSFVPKLHALLEENNIR